MVGKPNKGNKYNIINSIKVYLCIFYVNVGTSEKNKSLTHQNVMEHR